MTKIKAKNKKKSQKRKMAAARKPLNKFRSPGPAALAASSAVDKMKRKKGQPLSRTQIKDMSTKASLAPVPQRRLTI